MQNKSEKLSLVRKKVISIAGWLETIVILFNGIISLLMHTFDKNAKLFLYSCIIQKEIDWEYHNGIQ